MDTTIAATPVAGFIDRQCRTDAGAMNVRLPLPNACDVRIDGWLVRPSLNLLVRDQECVRVRAQLMDLLLCLARRPGRVFRKEELVAEVWEGRCVAGSALSRCIAELRAALGDDAQHPRVIETITKRGYRLVAPVEAVTVAQPQLSHLAGMAPMPPIPGGASGERRSTLRDFWQRLKRAAIRPA